MQSDGTRVGSVDRSRYCGFTDEFDVTCYFLGEVEVFYDLDTHEEWWDCPLCGTAHSEQYFND